MISTTGNLTTSDGLMFVNPLINICLISGDKFQPIKAVLYIGEVKYHVQPDMSEEPYFKSNYELLTFNYFFDTTDFDIIQNEVINNLSELYLNCTFEKI